MNENKRTDKQIKAIEVIEEFGSAEQLAHIKFIEDHLHVEPCKEKEELSFLAARLRRIKKPFKLVKYSYDFKKKSCPQFYSLFVECDKVSYSKEEALHFSQAGFTEDFREKNFIKGKRKQAW